LQWCDVTECAVLPRALLPWLTSICMSCHAVFCCPAPCAAAPAANPHRLRSSSLGCCHTPYGHQYYGEPHYPGESDYYAVLHRMISQTKQKYAARTTAADQSPQQASATLTSYHNPSVFSPRNGHVECRWEVRTHDPVVVDPTTKQIGTASAIW
jgi:hypothetical protein